MKTTAACIALALAGCLVACDAKGPVVVGGNTISSPTAEELTPVIADYLNGKHMEMKVKKFVSISSRNTAEGQTATATCSMVLQSELYATSVRWRFEFSRKGRGKWRVEKYEPVK
jgi:hypothetical protein